MEKEKYTMCTVHDKRQFCSPTPHERPSVGIREFAADLVLLGCQTKAEG